MIQPVAVPITRQQSSLIEFDLSISGFPCGIFQVDLGNSHHVFRKIIIDILLKLFSSLGTNC